MITCKRYCIHHIRIRILHKGYIYSYTSMQLHQSVKKGILYIYIYISNVGGVSEYAYKLHDVDN